MKVDSLINFEGYNPLWVSLFAAKHTSSKRSNLYMHNDMYNEWKIRFPYLEKNFRQYSSYDQLVSVSGKTMEHNRNNLNDLFNIGTEKFIFADNVQSPENIFSKAKLPLENPTDAIIFEGTKVFINIARLSPEKDQEKLIKAFKKVSENHPNARLINLGGGPLEHHLKELINKLDLQQKVFLLGQRSNPYPYLKQSDCFILSSNHEGQPMTLFEALILEKPIIATDIVGNRSVLKGRPGVLVDNSEEGLTQGMLDLLEGKHNTEKSFNYEEYNKNALNMFYNKVLQQSI